MDKLSALWQGASYQDKLLQSYRKFNLITQSAFMTMGAIATIFIVSFDQWFNQGLTYFVLVVLTTTALSCQSK